MTTQRAWCDGCRTTVDVVGTSGLCMGCYLVVRINALITAHTNLSEEEAFNLTKILQTAVMGALIQRLQVPGQEHPLAGELEQWMAPRPEERH